MPPKLEEPDLEEVEGGMCLRHLRPLQNSEIPTQTCIGGRRGRRLQLNWNTCIKLECTFIKQSDQNIKDLPNYSLNNRKWRLHSPVELSDWEKTQFHVYIPWRWGCLINRLH